MFFSSVLIGQLSDWWTQKSATEFKKRTRCLKEQYGNFTDEQVNLGLNGAHTLGENIADNGGLKETYMAYS